MFDGAYDAASMVPMIPARPSSKQPRASSTSNSAISRRNKLQRCSNCGGVGHKSRTCKTSFKMGAERDYGPSRSFLAPDSSHDLTVLAAYDLLSLQAQAWAPVAPVLPGSGPLQPRPPTQQQKTSSLVLQAASPPCSPARMSMSPQQHWQPLSPRLLAT